MRKRMKPRRSGLRGLGAVEGEKVEYFLPASIFNQMGKGAKSTIAFCMRDVEQLLPYLDQQAKFSEMKAQRLESRGASYASMVEQGGYMASVAEGRAKTAARSAKTKAKAGGLFAQTAAEIRKDIAEVRAQGIAGPIPVCMYRTSGKYGDKALKTAEARANRHHERFHADSRREEYRQGVPHYGCDAGVSKVLGSDLDPNLLQFSRVYWSMNGKAAAEEILARVEEADKASSYLERIAQLSEELDLAKRHYLDAMSRVRSITASL